MRALHVIPAVAPRYGGPSRAVTDMCRALTEAGVDGLVVTTDADGPAGRLPVTLGETVAYDGVPTIFFRREWSEALKYSRSLARWLDGHVVEFDVVHVHGVFSHACLAAGRACRRAGVPYLVRPLGSLDPWSLRQKRLRKRVLWTLGADRMLRQASAIHYTTAEERRLAERGLGLGRGVVVPLGVGDELLHGDVETGLFRRRHPELGDDPYILFLSRLHPKKGLEALVEAFGRIGSAEGLRRWRLVIAGDGEPRYVSGLRRLVARHGQSARTLFVGWVEGVDRLAAYRDAALFVLPSQQENFALSVAEAMALGVPVVVSDRVNLADDIRDAGAGWVSGAEPELGQALWAALSDKGERRARGLAGRALVRRRFTWSVVARQLLELYRGLVRGREGARVA
jgi:glycosyltransferase involved in cell wall biosynthesis